jgi:hypothetical protein
VIDQPHGSYQSQSTRRTEMRSAGPCQRIVSPPFEDDAPRAPRLGAVTSSTEARSSCSHQGLPKCPRSVFSTTRRGAILCAQLAHALEAVVHPDRLTDRLKA